MAKKTLARRAARIRVITRRAAPLARRGVGAAATQAREEKHRIVAVLAAGAIGYAKKQNMNLPHVAMLGVPATYGLGLAVAARFTKSRMLDHAATGLLSVALYEFAMAPSAASPGGVTAGEDDLVIG